jgi:lysozyme
MTDFPITTPAVSRSETAKLTGDLDTQQWPITGIDVSRWQKEIQWEKALSAGLTFAFIKASEGSTIIDSQFHRNMQETANLNIPRGIYHFFRPDKDWKAQANHFTSLIQSYDIELDIVADIERDAGLSKHQLANVVEKFVTHVEDTSGRQLMIYTSPGFWDSHMPITGWAHDRRLWVAHWTSRPNPTLPQEWSKPGKPWTFWQHSSKNQLGPDYGVATKSIDLNRFNGSHEQFMQQYNLTSLPTPIDPPSPPPPDPEPIPVGNVPLFEVLNPHVHIFTRPTVSSEITGELEMGDVVELLDLRGSDEVWVQIEPAKWILFAYNGQPLLKKVT